MLTAILILQVIQTLLASMAFLLAWRADRLAMWCQEVLLPWMVKIASLLRDDYNPPPPPAPPGPG